MPKRQSQREPLTRDVLRSLRTAKRLLRVAEPLCLSGEKHGASAGLLVLHDAVELVLLACIEAKSPPDEEFEHDEQFGKLLKVAQQRKVKIYKPEVLKAMNRLRGLVKHKGRVAEPGDVAGMFTDVSTGIDKALDSVCGLTLHDVFLHQLIHSDSRSYLEAAAEAIGERRPLDALVDIRCALFLEFEREYAVDAFENATPAQMKTFAFGLFEGWKAPWHTRNPDWIRENVKEPTQFVQIDHDRLTLELLELGISPREFHSLRRLTPDVHLRRGSTSWCVRLPAGAVSDAQTEADAQWCLDQATEMLLAKQEHAAGHRRTHGDLSVIAVLSTDASLYERASLDSPVVKILRSGQRLLADAVVNSLVGEMRFVHLAHVGLEPPEALFGFVLESACNLEPIVATEQPPGQESAAKPAE